MVKYWASSTVQARVSDKIGRSLPCGFYICHAVHSKERQAGVQSVHILNISWVWFGDQCARTCMYCTCHTQKHATTSIHEVVQVELIEPPASASLGERVTAQGYEAEPDEQLNPKKKASTQRTISVSLQS